MHHRPAGEARITLRARRRTRRRHAGRSRPRVGPTCPGRRPTRHTGIRLDPRRRRPHRPTVLGSSHLAEPAERTESRPELGRTLTRHQKHPPQAPALRRDSGKGCPGPHSDRTRRAGRARSMDRHRHTERRAGYCRDRPPPRGIGRRYRLTRTSKTTQPNSPGALCQTPTTSAIPIASLMAGHHPAPIRHDHPRTATPRATCLDYNAFAMAEVAPNVADPPPLAAAIRRAERNNFRVEAMT